MLKKDTTPMDVPFMPCEATSVREFNPFKAAELLTYLYLEEARLGVVPAFDDYKTACAEAMRGMCEF